MLFLSNEETLKRDVIQCMSKKMNLLGSYDLLDFSSYSKSNIALLDVFENLSFKISNGKILIEGNLNNSQLNVMNKKTLKNIKKIDEQIMEDNIKKEKLKQNLSPLEEMIKASSEALENYNNHFLDLNSNNVRKRTQTDYDFMDSAIHILKEELNVDAKKEIYEYELVICFDVDKLILNDRQKTYLIGLALAADYFTIGINNNKINFNIAIIAKE